MRERENDMESWRGMKGDGSQVEADEEKPLSDREEEREDSERRSDSDHKRAQR